MSEMLIATVQSSNKPLPGQGWRSSDDFGTTLAPPNTKYLRWDIDPNTPNPEDIVFDVAEDHSGKDKTVFTNIMSGNRTTFDRYDKLYIGNPRAAAPFTVKVFAIY
ncbi:MAG TPA: DeoR family transcriptional regulator [Polyangium sp.]|nr:DeoR family transcriptional regulator [Polyangium sp.]